LALAMVHQRMSAGHGRRIDDSRFCRKARSGTGSGCTSSRVRRRPRCAAGQP
jgi:hypothetical protein